MKNLIKIWSLIVLFTFVLSSCSKDQEFENFDNQQDFENEQFDDYTDNLDDDEYYDDYEDDYDDDGHNHDEASGDNALTLYKVSNGSITKIKDFDVAANLKSYQQDQGKHQEMWEFYTRLIPADQIAFIKEFEVFYGDNSLAGYVNHIDNDNSKWKLGLAIDLATTLTDIDLADEFTYTCIHEQAHILTLNNTQVNGSANACANFELAEGCSKPNSYINRLFELGWADIYDEHQNLQSDQDVQNFYNKYSTRFVTDYAATNPGEDIAEVFTFFVTMDQLPTGNSIADKKIRLLSEYPELVELRKEIRQNPSTTRLKPGSWKSRKCQHSPKKRVPTSV